MLRNSFEFATQLIARLKSESEGQDLVEYALLVGFMVIAIWAFFPTQIVPSMSTIFGKIINTAALVGG
jgi:Flp pilus assembly pilin Flp